MRLASRPVGRRFAMSGYRRGAALTGVAGLFAATLVGVSPGSASADVVSTQPVTAADEVAADAVTAAGLAWRDRRPVEVLSERTESSETFVLPDGTWRTRQYASPVRVRRGSGWVSVDPTLTTVAGAVVPRATVLDMRFSGGGAGPLVTVVRDGRSLAISWPAALPVPTLSGDTATYGEVLPGVDLRLSAKADSFSQVFVVKDAAGARNPELERLRFGLASQGLVVRQDGSGFLTATAPSGEVVFASDGARMWDEPQLLTAHPPAARSLRESAKSVAADALPQDPESLHTEDVPVQLDGSSLTVVPSRSMLTASDTRFPVYIDPGFNGGSEIWTHVSRKNPSKSYWTDSATRDAMRVGQLWHGSSDDDWRTLVQFDITKLKKSDIKSAAVIVNVQHSADCSPSPLQLWQTDPISKSAAVTWNSVTATGRWWKVLGEVQATANKSACPKGNDEVRFTQSAVKSAFQTATAPAKPSTITFAFRAKSESDEYQWKKLKAGSTYLDVVYNNKPGKPTGLAFSPCFTACASGSAVTSVKRPTLTMKVADADGGTLRYEYEVYKTDKTTRMATSGTTVTGVAQNTAKPWTLKSDLPDGSYVWRGRGCDGYGCGDDSDWYGFKVDTANPTTPSVTSDDYPPTGWNGGPGISGKFTFAPGAASDGVKTYYYSLNGGKELPAEPDAATGVVTKDIAPTKDFDNVLAVRAVDTAGNLSGTKQYPFRVKPVGATWHWALDEGSGTVAASTPEDNRPATMAGTGVTWSVPGKDSDAAMSLSGDGELTTVLPVVDTSKAFTVAAWVHLPQPLTKPDTSGSGTDPSAGDDPDAEQTPPNDEQVPEKLTLPARNLVAVSQDGRNTSMFRLGYRVDLDVTGDGVADPAWCFTVANTDVVGSPTANACTTAFVNAEAWVHLVGIVDPTVAKPIQLYVNGTPAKQGAFADVTGGAGWEANGSLAIGRGWNGVPTDRWMGQLDEVYVTPRVWTRQEIDQKAGVDDAADG